MQVSPIEITLLKALEPGKRYEVSEAASISGMKRDAVLKAAHLLQEKGLAKVEIVTKKIFRLTEEGKRYLEEGLPEERLVKLIEKPMSIKELEEVMGKREFGIALGWLRKKKAVEVKDGIVKLVSKPEFGEKESLRAVAEGRDIDAKDVKDLLRRKLVDFDEEKGDIRYCFGEARS